MRCQPRQTEPRGVVFNNVPNHSVSHKIAPGLASPTNATKQLAIAYAGRGDPLTDRLRHAIRDRHGPDLPAFTCQINYGPVILSALAFLLVPSLASQLLFGQPSQVALAEILGRLLGAAVLSLAAACWWAGGDCRSPMAYSVIKAVLVYDAVAAGLLVYARMDLGLSGILLWVGVVVHIALGCLLCRGS